MKAIAVIAALSLFSLFTLNSAGLLQNLRTVDLLHLIATGMLLGALLTLIMQYILAQRANPQ